MRELVLDLVSYSHLIHESGVHFATVDMNAVVGSALQVFDSLIRERGAQVEVQNLPAVTGDAA